ncbi:MAG TPA: hypothetical protein PK643_04565 [Saprospiraceae bacterium]|nr:hypothetical protein [Saprospiraceae bacterium]
MIPCMKVININGEILGQRCNYVTIPWISIHQGSHAAPVRVN